MSGRSAKIDLLAIGHAPEGGGFARVMHEILRCLSKSFEVCQLGLGASESSSLAGWDVHAGRGPGDLHGAELLRQLLRRVQPRIVLILHDPWMLPLYVDLVRENHRQVRIVTYCPLDGDLLEPQLAGVIRDVDQFVVYTEHARRQFAQALTAIDPKGTALARARLAVIPHGVDRSTFRPVVDPVTGAGGETARRAVFRGRHDLDQGFVVLNANRNMLRKQLAITIEGFAAFACNKPREVRLCLHTEPHGDVDILAAARYYGIESRLLLTRNPTTPLSDGELNLLYNACVVGVNTSDREGWGLVSLEHAATGAAQIVPDHGACAEVWADSAEILSTELSPPRPGDFVSRRVTSAGGVCTALDRLYHDPDHLAAVSGACLALASRTEYDWDRIGERWADLLNRVSLSSL